MKDEGFHGGTMGASSEGESGATPLESDPPFQTSRSDENIAVKSPVSFVG